MKQYPKPPRCKNESLFAQKKGIEVEPELGAFLYGLIRMHKPALCIETGTYTGESAEWIGRALRDNDYGRLITCDTERSYVRHSAARLNGLPVEVRLQDGTDLIREFTTGWPGNLKGTVHIDFLFLDGGEPQARRDQLQVVIDSGLIAPGGYLVWHDAVIWNPGLYDMFAPTHDWPHLILPTPVGVAVFQRPL